MKSASNNNGVREQFHPITDDRETITSNYNQEPGEYEQVLSNSIQRLHQRSSVDNESNQSVVLGELSPSNTQEGNNNRMLSHQNILEIPYNNQTLQPSAVVDNHEQWNTAIGDQESLHEGLLTNNNSSEGSVLEHNNNNPPGKEQCSPGLLHKRARHKADTEDDTSYALQREVKLERLNGEGICSALESNVQVKESNGCTKSVVSRSLGSGISGMNVEFLNKESGCNNVHHITSINEREPETFIKNESTVTKEESQTVSDYLKTLDEGRYVCGDTYVKFSKPDWFDKEKFQRGQRFAMNHIFGVMFAELISLMILFANKGGLEPLIFTGKSDTPFKAFKRYLSTVVRVKSWYEGDIWDEESEAHKNLKAVRCMHETVRKNMEGGPAHEVAKRITLEGGGSPLWTDLHGDITEDFRSSCPFSKTPLTSETEVFVNQCDMGMTQFGFLGLILLFPKKFGVHFATEEDFEGFSHFWRTIGYLLGTDDRYNLCNGDLQTVRRRCSDIIEHWVKPAFRDVTRDWIHMSRCVFKGVSFYIMNVKFEVMLVYLCNVLDMKALRLVASLTLWQSFLYHLIDHLFRFLFRLTSILRLFNFFVNLAVKIAVQFGPKHMMRLERIKYPYETSSESYSTRL